MGKDLRKGGEGPKKEWERPQEGWENPWEGPREAGAEHLRSDPSKSWMQPWMHQDPSMIAQGGMSQVPLWSKNSMRQRWELRGSRSIPVLQGGVPREVT